jgi:hypothetical protein
MDNIKCPRCGSEQVSANKKGWTVTTGLIGSSKIIITCLKCGKQFRPGQDMEAMKKKKLQQAKAMKSPLFWIFFGLILIFFIWMVKSCFTSNSTVDSIAEHDGITTEENSIPDSIAKWYEIVNTDIEAVNHKYFLYIKDTSLALRYYSKIFNWLGFSSLKFCFIELANKSVMGVLSNMQMLITCNIS